MINFVGGLSGLFGINYFSCVGSFQSTTFDYIGVKMMELDPDLLLELVAVIKDSVRSRRIYLSIFCCCCFKAAAWRKESDRNCSVTVRCPSQLWGFFGILAESFADSSGSLRILEWNPWRIALARRAATELIHVRPRSLSGLQGRPGLFRIAAIKGIIRDRTLLFVESHQWDGHDDASIAFPLDLR